VGVAIAQGGRASRPRVGIVSSMYYYSYYIGANTPDTPDTGDTPLYPPLPQYFR
jgi:hypothetical protein